MAYVKTAGEKRWISASGDPEAAGACCRIAAGVNTKDPLLIIDVLSEDCTYESQSHYGKLRGRGPVGEHFAVVLENIRRAGPAREAKAELAVEPAGGGPCVLIHQRDSAYGRPGLGRPNGYFTVHDLRDGKAGALFKVTAVPNPWSCRRSGLFPGLTVGDVKEAMDFPGPRLPRSGEVTLMLFTFGQPDSPWDERMKEAVEEILPEFRPVRLRLCTAGDKGLHLGYGVTSFPSLAVIYGGAPVMILEGLHTARDLREVLDALFE